YSAPAGAAGASGTAPVGRGAGLSKTPASTVAPAQSRTRAFVGTPTWDRAPTAVIVAPSMRTVPSSIGAASGCDCTRPPTSASVVPVNGVSRDDDGDTQPAASATATSAHTRPL